MAQARAVESGREELKLPTRTLVLAVALAAMAAAAWAHSLHEFETALGDREKYFQAIDKDAPIFSLQDSEARAVSLADFRGKVVVLHFIYASCPDICPLHSERIAEIQKMVNPSAMKERVQFISITTDPANDRPEILRDYGPAHGLDSANWVFLTTRPGQAEDTTRKLAEQFGHRFEKAEDGFQTHGIVTHVIDKEGRWRANFYGLKFEPTNLVIFVNALINDIEKPHQHPASPLWEKLRRLF